MPWFIQILNMTFVICSAKTIILSTFFWQTIVTECLHWFRVSFSQTLWKKYFAKITDVVAGTRRIIQNVKSTHEVRDLVPGRWYEVTSTFVVRGVSSAASIPARFRPQTTGMCLCNAVVFNLGSPAFFLGVARSSDKNIHNFFHILYLVYGTTFCCSQNIRITWQKW